MNPRARWISAALLATALLSACGALRRGGRAGGDPDLALLAEWLTGSFGSQRQAAADSAFFDIRLRMAPIWEGRADGVWLYVEQAVHGHELRPYRQRVYRLRRLDARRLESAVFELPGPERFVGAAGDAGCFAALTPDSLLPRAGCAIVLRRRADGAFAGATEAGACPSTLHGAAYATSEVVLTADRLVSWDRGWDARGEQVWGAVKEGYVFDRLPAGD